MRIFPLILAALHNLARAHVEAKLEVTVGAPAAPAPAEDERPLSNVEIVDALDAAADRHPEGLDWRHSIVDLLKALGLADSLFARRQLAAECGYDEVFDGTAEQNIWLHGRVLKKVAEHGINLPSA